jgi:hypothetical protein
LVTCWAGLAECLDCSDEQSARDDSTDEDHDGISNVGGVSGADHRADRKTEQDRERPTEDETEAVDGSKRGARRRTSRFRVGVVKAVDASWSEPNRLGRADALGRHIDAGHGCNKLRLRTVVVGQVSSHGTFA